MEPKNYTYDPKSLDYCESFHRLKNKLKVGMEEPAEAPWLWVGAGLSVPAGYPTGTELANEMRELLTPGVVRDNRLQKAGYEQMALELNKRNKKKELEKLLHRLFKKGSDQPLENHLLLAQMQWGQVITTNYDQLLENAWLKVGRKYERVILEQNIDFQSYTDTAIWKIHGDKDDWAKIILSQSDYDEYGKRYRKLSETIRSSFKRAYIFFIGCSMQDQRIYAALEGLEAGDAQGGVYLIRKRDYDELTNEQVKILAEHDFLPLIFEDFEEIPEILRLLLALPLTIASSKFCVPYPSLGQFYQELKGLMLEEIHNALTLRSSLVLKQIISGDGGIGKTTTAIEYAHRYQKYYTGGVYWFDCQGFDTMVSSLEDIARTLNLRLRDSDSDEQRWKDGVKGIWAQNGRQLWILDNLEDEKLLEYFNFKTPILITYIITTRRCGYRIMDEFKLQKISLPDIHEAERMLYTYANKNKETCSFSEQEAARELVRRFDRLPLALELAGKTISNGGFSFVEYLNEVWANGINAIGINQKETLPNRHLASIKETYKVDTKINSDERLKRLLLNLSLMAPDNIEEWLLQFVMEDENLTVDINRLIQLGWVKRDENGFIYMHRLVQEAIRENEAEKLPVKSI